MTEAEWLACAEPHEMLELVRGRATDRKFRLFQVACCRRVWGLLPDDDCRQAVLVAERYADGNATDRERRAMCNAVAHYGEKASLLEINARSAAFHANEKTVWRRPLVFLGVAAVVGHAANPTREHREAYKSAYQAEKKAEATLVRCIFGNPFRSAPDLSPWVLTWNEGTVVQVARAIYEDRAFDRLPILADALAEAGCTNADLLSHCRHPGEHARGCWVVDRLLGLE